MDEAHWGQEEPDIIRSQNERKRKRSQLIMPLHERMLVTFEVAPKEFEPCSSRTSTRPDPDRRRSVVLGLLGRMEAASRLWTRSGNGRAGADEADYLLGATRSRKKNALVEDPGKAQQAGGRSWKPTCRPSTKFWCRAARPPSPIKRDEPKVAERRLPLRQRQEVQEVPRRRHGRISR